jgi:hypothetical protein
VTFNVVNLRRQRSTSYVSNFVNVLTCNVLIAISDDELILTNHLCSAFVFYSTQLIFKLQEVNKEINKEYYKLVACQMFMTNLLKAQLTVRLFL